MIILCSLENA